MLRNILSLSTASWLLEFSFVDSQVLEATTDGYPLILDEARRLESAYLMAEQPVLLILGRGRRLQRIFLQVLNRYVVSPDADVNFIHGDPTKDAVYPTDFIIEDWEAKSRKLNGIKADPLEDSNMASAKFSVKVVVAPGIDSFKVSRNQPSVATEQSAISSSLNFYAI